MAKGGSFAEDQNGYYSKEKLAGSADMIDMGLYNELNNSTEGSDIDCYLKITKLGGSKEELKTNKNFIEDLNEKEFSSMINLK